jgi:hypothetical protein
MPTMDDAVIATHLKNLDRRLSRVEEILPSLATKEDLRLLATKEELQALATKEELAAQWAELRREIRDEGERSRRHMDVLIEAQRGDIQLLAEHLSVVRSRLADK